MSNPVAVLISDIHFTPATLELATSSLMQAQLEAARLNVPLVIAGDTLDTKAVIRAECANKVISILQESSCTINTYVLVGNHDKINEKSNEHALNFLEPYCTLVDEVRWVPELDSYLIPYKSNVEELKHILSILTKNTRVIMHQGVLGADMGHYVQDKTSLPKEAFADFRVISGHYHKRQDIKCGRPQQGAVGLFSYIGNPYTLSFGEANDPEKGFQILNSDGILTFVPTNLRRHVILECRVQDLNGPMMLTSQDLLWVKVTGTKRELDQLDKNEIGKRLIGHSDYRLEKVYQDIDLSEIKTENLKDTVILDSMIDKLEESPEQKKHLKELWRTL